MSPLRPSTPRVPRPARAFRTVRDTAAHALHALTHWPAAKWAVAVGGAVLGALVVGLPTAVVPNPVFGRTVPTQWWNYPVLTVTALLGGLLLATYVRTGRERVEGTEHTQRTEPENATARRLGPAGGVLTYFAVGCPVCNKLALLLLGTSGALNIWAPLQPLVALASVALLAVAAVRRLAGETACPVAAA